MLFFLWCNVRCNDEIGYSEVCGAVKKLKGDKLPGIDEIAVEYLKKGGMYVIECLVRMFNGCMREERVHVLFLCLKGIDLISVMGKVYGGYWWNA